MVTVKVDKVESSILLITVVLMLINEKTNQLINKKDTNGDEVLEYWGIRCSLKPPFNQIDKNGDGQTGRGEHNVTAHKRSSCC